MAMKAWALEGAGYSWLFLCGQRAEAMAAAPAVKILLPLTGTRMEIAGFIPEPLPYLLEKAITGRLKEFLKNV
ncbi:MAG: hypothetical protein ACLPT6_10505 [Desulfobaccales bacterium]